MSLFQQPARNGETCPYTNTIVLIAIRVLSTCNSRPVRRLPALSAKTNRWRENCRSFLRVEVSVQMRDPAADVDAPRVHAGAIRTLGKYRLRKIAIEDRPELP